MPVKGLQGAVVDAYAVAHIVADNDLVLFHTQGQNLLLRQGDGLVAGLADKTGDAADVADDVVAHLSHELIGQVGPVGGHGIGGCYGAESYCAFVGAFVAHHTHALYGQQYHAGLPYLVVEVPVAQAADEDVVGILQYAYLFGGDVAKDTYGQTRTGKG